VLGVGLGHGLQKNARLLNISHLGLTRYLQTVQTSQVALRRKKISS
jgi:hypothetical protein